VAAEGGDVDRFQIGSPDGERPVVGLDDIPAIIDVLKPEHSPFAGVRGFADLSGDRAVEQIQLQLTPAVDLKHASRRARPNAYPRPIEHAGRHRGCDRRENQVLSE
jgi:hypothetical protein